MPKEKELEVEIAAAMIQDVRDQNWAYVSSIDEHWSVVVDGDVDFLRLARVAIKAIKNGD